LGERSVPGRPRISVDGSPRSREKEDSESGREKKANFGETSPLVSIGRLRLYPEKSTVGGGRISERRKAVAKRICHESVGG